MLLSIPQEHHPEFYFPDGTVIFLVGPILNDGDLVLRADF